jgi:hypothetical protein
VTRIVEANTALGDDTADARAWTASSTADRSGR